MKKTVLTSLTILSLTFSFCIIRACMDAYIVYASPYTEISVDTAYNMIMNGSYPNLVVLDVRTLSEYEDGHIRNARLIPHTELEGRLDELNKTDEILVYCRSGVRSSIASLILADNGFLCVYNMLEGTTAWIAEGFPVYIRYSSIQEAINDASEGDDIYVSSGTYYEHITVNKALTLLGENNAILDGGGHGTAFSVTSNNVTINGFTIRNAGSGTLACISVTASSCTIINNRIIDSHWDTIALYNSTFCDIYNNTIVNAYPNGYGITLMFSCHNRIRSNTIYNLTNGYGIWFDTGCEANVIAENTITKCKWAGIYLHAMSEGHPFNNTITMNTLLNITNYGIDVYGSRNNILANEIFYSFGGVSATCVDHASIVGNTIVHCWANGMRLVEAENCTVLNNEIRNSEYGIYLRASRNTDIIENIVGNCTDNGIWLKHCTATRIWHNNFINNTSQAYLQTSSHQTWDDGYPSGGNHWSDYNGRDFYSGPYQNETGRDGIGDVVFAIDENNTDNYPLMYPFGSEMEGVWAAHRNLLLRFAEIRSELKELKADYEGLKKEYDALSQSFDSLSSDYNSLSANCNDMLLLYDALMEKHKQTILTIIFSGIVVVVVMVYLAIGKRKIKP